MVIIMRHTAVCLYMCCLLRDATCCVCTLLPIASNCFLLFPIVFNCFLFFTASPSLHLRLATVYKVKLRRTMRGAGGAKGCMSACVPMRRTMVRLYNGFNNAIFLYFPYHSEPSLRAQRSNLLLFYFLLMPEI